MFISKQEVWYMKQRIEELEQLLCPVQQHDYIEVDRTCEYDSNGERYDVVTYQCRRCLKKKVRTEV